MLIASALSLPPLAPCFRKRNPHPFGDLALIGQGAVTGIDGAVNPALPLLSEGDAVELAGGSSRVPKAIDVWFTVRQAALGNLENLVRDGRCLVKQVERGRC